PCELRSGCKRRMSVLRAPAARDVRTMRTFQFLVWSILASVGWLGTGLAQPVAPPPPKEYDVQIRYRILAARNERIVQFNAMVGYVESIGFRKEPGPEDE